MSHAIYDCCVTLEHVTNNVLCNATYAMTNNATYLAVVITVHHYYSQIIDIITLVYLLLQPRLAWDEGGVSVEIYIYV